MFLIHILQCEQIEDVTLLRYEQTVVLFYIIRIEIYTWLSITLSNSMMALLCKLTMILFMIIQNIFLNNFSNCISEI